METSPSQYPSSLTSVYQTATPLAGDTVIGTATASNLLTWITPAGTLLTLTYTLPSNASSVIGQVVRIGSSQAVTTLTINGATTILNTITALVAGACVQLIKVADNTWTRLI
jgi:hypothetical protein